MIGARDTDTLNPYYEGFTQTITEVVSAAVTYTGYSTPSTPTSARKWYISKTEKVGGTTYVNWALDGDFAIWDDRTTYFGSTPVPSFTNQYSVLFDGVNDYCTGPVGPLNEERNIPVSISMWVKPTAGATSALISTYNVARTGKYLGLNANGTALMYVSNASANAILVTTASVCVPVGQWTHVVMTYNGNQLASGVKIYTNTLNQVLVTNQNNLSGTTVSNQVPSVGAVLFPTATSFFPGSIDEVSLWDKALTAAEIIELYNTGLPGNLATHSATANLTHWWRMGDNDTYPTLLDGRGTSDLTMINMLSSNIQAVVP